MNMNESLDRLSARAPWTTTDGVLTEAMLREVYMAVRDDRALPFHRSDRRMDRALQLLRRGGLIRFAAVLGWVPVT